MPPQITIRREIIEAEVEGTEADGVALQRHMADAGADALDSALEAAFARVDPGDEHLMIERLAIDLAVSLDRFDAELADAVLREVADYFRRNPVPSGPAPTMDAGDVRRRTPAEAVNEAILMFLRTGRLPWSFRVPPGSRLEQIVLDAWGASDAERGPPPGMRVHLFELLAQPTARARLLMQFTPGFVMTVLRGLSPRLTTSIEDVLGALDQLSIPAPFRTTFARRVWEQALAAAAEGRALEPADLARAAWRTVTPADRGHSPLAQAIERRWPGVTEHDGAPPNLDEAQAPPPIPSPRPVDLADESEGILVDNAGIVLVHPFLPRFLDGLGVALDDELVDPGRALCLIHHLATGEPTAPEHQLTLAKILCGVRLDEPTEEDVGITETETEEAIALLDAAIGHWGALGGSSPDALRGEFLMRPGAVAADADGGWLLRVEARSVDVLLDQLPWGLSLVKLPWMDRPLRVDWR